MKKVLVFLTALLVCWLAAGYYTARQQILNESLVADAYYGDLVSVKNDLEDGADISFELYFDDEDRQYTDVLFNALHAASSSGNEDVINFLLEEGLNIDYPTPEGWTPLFIAARDGQSEAAKLLVFRGADLNIQTDRGATALLMAITQEYPSETDRNSLLEYMLKRGADPNLADGNGFSPLYYAATLKNVTAVKLLLEYDAVPDEENLSKISRILAPLSDNASRDILSLLKKARKNAKTK